MNVTNRKNVSVQLTAFNSFSDDDADTQDSLEIKPPQAVVHHHKKSREHRRDKHAERSGERRDKEYKPSRHHDDRHHREKHRESRYRRPEPDQYEKTRRSEPTKRDRDLSRYERKERSTGDRVLEDLRERYFALLCSCLYHFFFLSIDVCSRLTALSLLSLFTVIIY